MQLLNVINLCNNNYHIMK